MDDSDVHRTLIDANQAYAQEASAVAPSKHPERKLFVLTCMDARVDPLRLLGLQLGDAHVVRNAGGRVTEDVVRSLVLSSAVLGTRHVAVVHHTDCGLRADSDEHVRTQLREAGVDVGDMVIGTFTDDERSVREDVAALSDDPRAGTVATVHGYLYDVASRRLRPVEPA